MGFIKNWLVRWGLVICAALFAASYAFPVSWDTVLAAPALLIAAPRIHQYGIPGCIVVHRSHENPRRGLDLPADYFMPYSVCPKCKVEALHWMEKPDVDWATATLKAMKERFDDQWSQYRSMRREFPNFYSMQHGIDLYRPVATAEESRALSITEGGIDVNRTCRECSHTWGQKVGYLTGVA